VQKQFPLMDFTHRVGNEALSLKSCSRRVKCFVGNTIMIQTLFLLLLFLNIALLLIVTFYGNVDADAGFFPNLSMVLDYWVI
jgi:hypothetical protein